MLPLMFDHLLLGAAVGALAAVLLLALIGCAGRRSRPRQGLRADAEFRRARAS